jgi:uncharacterized membrane protein YwzB
MNIIGMIILILVAVVIGYGIIKFGIDILNLTNKK